MSFRTILYLFVLLVVCTAKLKAQHPHSLSDKSFDELYEQSKALFAQKDTQKALLYFEAYKQKAVRENNTERLVNIYRSMAIWQTALEQKIAYADSAIHIARTTNNDEFIGNALYTKGVVYYKYNDWNKTLDYYLLADNHISKTGNEYSKNKLKYAVFQAKYTLGDYDEALSIIQECVAYFEQYDDNNHRKGYLSSLHSLGLCLNRMERYKECSEVNRKGSEKAAEFDLNEMQYSFSSSEGINQYDLDNYQQALEHFECSLPFFIDSGNTKQQAVISFFMGKSYMGLNKNKQAVTCFEKVDSLFAETGYLRDDMAENYVFLIDNAKKQRNPEKELYYTNRLLEADKLLYNQYKDIAVTIHKKYDTKKLQESKASLEKLLGQKTAANEWLTLSLLIAFTGILLLSARYIYYRKRFKKLYRQFTDSLSDPAQNTVATGNPSERVPVSRQQEIKENVIHRVLKGLIRFESNKGFTKQNLTLIKLAESLNTNPKYLSKIITEHKQKDYSQYINDLRINHLKELLKTKKYLEYKIEALAKEIGFGSAKCFNTAFYKATGMKFSDFFNEYRKDHKEKHYSLSESENQSYADSDVMVSGLNFKTDIST